MVCGHVVGATVVWRFRWLFLFFFAFGYIFPSRPTENPEHVNRGFASARVRSVTTDRESEARSDLLRSSRTTRTMPSVCWQSWWWPTSSTHGARASKQAQVEIPACSATFASTARARSPSWRRLVAPDPPPLQISPASCTAGSVAPTSFSEVSR